MGTWVGTHMPMRPPFNPTCRLCGVTRESLQWRRVFGGLKTCSSAVHACCCPQLESCIPPWGPGIVLLAAAARQLPATTSAASGFLPSELNARIVQPLPRNYTATPSYDYQTASKGTWHARTALLQQFLVLATARYSAVQVTSVSYTCW